MNKEGPYMATLITLGFIWTAWHAVGRAGAGDVTAWVDVVFNLVLALDTGSKIVTHVTRRAERD